jgi:integrase
MRSVRARSVKPSDVWSLRPAFRGSVFTISVCAHASNLLMAGVNVKVVSERLGHASVSFTLDTYAHVMPGQQAEAAAAAAALLGTRCDGARAMSHPTG